MSRALFGAPIPGFDDPLALLAGCHERILRYSAWLDALVRREVEAAEVGPRIHHYFTTAGVYHHQDEEEDLFPLLLPHGMGDLVKHLHAEHERLDQLWAECALCLETLSPAAGRAAAQFAALSVEHVQCENERILPLAAQVLTVAERAQLGAAMARRRGVSLARGP